MDLKGWLKEAGVSDAHIDAIVATGGLTDAVVANIEKGYLRQSDYSKQMDAVKKEREDLAAANERVNEEMLAIAEARNAGEPITAQMRKDLADARAEVTRLQTVVTTRATELGLDPKSIIGEPAAPAKPDAPAAPDLKGYVKVEDVNSALRNSLAYSLDTTAELEALRDEHFELTGKRLDTRPLIAELQRRASDKANRNTDGTPKQPVDVRAIWEEKHGIGQLRADQAKAKHDAEIKAAEDRGYTRRATEQALPGENPVGRHAPVLTSLRKSEDAAKLPRPSQAAHNNRISSAAEAFTTGRYRGNPGGQKTGTAA